MDNYSLKYTGEEIDEILEKADLLGPATEGAAGLMSAADKAKLNSVSQGAQVNVIESIRIQGAQGDVMVSGKKATIPVDSVPTGGSKNLVLSGVIAEALAKKAAVDAHSLGGSTGVEFSPTNGGFLLEISSNSYTGIFLVSCINDDYTNTRVFSMNQVLLSDLAIEFYLDPENEKLIVWTVDGATVRILGIRNESPEVMEIDEIPSAALGEQVEVEHFAVDADLVNFITKSVDDLVNYYTKSQTYTKAEVNALVEAIKQFTYQVVATLPTASADTMNIIFLVPSSNPETQNVKDEFITIRSGSEGAYTYSWEQIGSTEIDLSGYSTTVQMNAAISAAVTAALGTVASTYATKTEVNQLGQEVADMNSVYVENPEYVRAVVDKDGRFLYGVKENGEFVFGKGVPEQVVNYISGLLAEKVDKESGKALIDALYAGNVETIENQEYSAIVVNEDGGIILGFRNDGKVIFGKDDTKVLNKLCKQEGLSIATTLTGVTFPDAPTIILRNTDADATLYENIYLGFGSVVKISNSMYYLYYAAYGDNSEHKSGGGVLEVGINILMAYSTDGIHWTRGFPSGVTAPNPGTNIIGITDGEGNNLINRVTEFHIFKVCDDEYPFRMLANHSVNNTAYACMWKSADGINFTGYKRIIKATDTQLCGIPQGRLIKVYCRDYDKFDDGTRKSYINGRRIGVFYIDIDGNLVSPRRVLFGSNLYQASATINTENSQILFPTEYGIYADDSQRVKCYVVDGDIIKELPIDNSILMDNLAMKSIYIVPGLVDINGELYMYYMTSARLHNQTWTANQEMQFRVIKVNLKYN